MTNYIRALRANLDGHRQTEAALKRQIDLKQVETMRIETEIEILGKARMALREIIANYEEIIARTAAADQAEATRAAV